jgi:hypothetical protein
MTVPGGTFRQQCLRLGNIETDDGRIGNIVGLFIRLEQRLDPLPQSGITPTGHVQVRVPLGRRLLLQGVREYGLNVC